MSKTRKNTRKHLAAARVRVAREKKVAAVANESFFRLQHTDETRKMLRRIDPERTLALAEGRLP